jgi:hypothetical protein
MRRSLVQADDGAHHPFLQTLPPHVRQQNAAETDPVRRRNRVDQREASAARRSARKSWWRRQREDGKITVQDVKDFLLAYCACFVAVSAFIA